MIRISNCIGFSKSTAYWRQRQQDFAVRNGAFAQRIMPAIRFDLGQFQVTALPLF
jgi:hypothetical protein